MAHRWIPAADLTSNQRTPKIEDKPHLDFICALPCVICLREGQTEACHIRYNDSRYLKEAGGGAKPDDKWAVPMCTRHHKQQTDCGEGRTFWDVHGFDPHALALMLHYVSPDITRGKRVVINWNNAIS